MAVSRATGIVSSSLSRAMGGIPSLDKVFVPTKISEKRWGITVGFPQHSQMVFFFDSLKDSAGGGVVYMKHLFYFLRDSYEKNNWPFPDPT